MFINKFKQLLRYVLSIIFVIVVLYLVFHNSYKEIIYSLTRLSLFSVILLLFMGSGFVLLNTLSYYVLMKAQFKDLSFQQIFEVTMLGVFGNVVTSSAGTIPLQSYYLYQHGIDVGKGISAMTLQNVFYRFTVLIYSIVMLFFNIDFLNTQISESMKYIYLGIIVCAFLIITLMALCMSKKLQNIFKMILSKLPGKWDDKKQVWINHLDDLYHQSKEIMKSGCFIKVMLVCVVMLFWRFSIHYWTLKILGYDGLSFGRVQILSSLMILIVQVLPNVSGVGPTEIGYIMVFGPFIGVSQASSSLVLYRIADYFWPFILSLIVFLKVRCHK